MESFFRLLPQWIDMMCRGIDKVKLWGNVSLLDLTIAVIIINVILAIINIKGEK